VSSTRAHDGTRFAEERAFFAEAAARFDALGWPRAARAARWHLTSRLHALRTLPGLLAAGHLDAARAGLRGALTPLPSHAAARAALGHAVVTHPGEGAPR
jgi:hypothetical protein